MCVKSMKELSEMLQQFSLLGEVSIVTGASRGLGFAMARALASVGSSIVAVGRDPIALEKAVTELQSSLNSDVPIIALPANVTKEEDRKRVIDETLKKFGKIDVLVNNAGINIRKPFLEFSEADFDKVVDVNLKAVFFMTQLVARAMIQRKKGKIINIASLTSVIGITNISAYGATKGGVASLTKALAVELAPYNIRVNAIAPGYYKTKLTEAVFTDEQRRQWILSRIPLGRSGIPDDLAGTVVFLASSASDYITGQIIFVDGGWTAA